MRRLLVLFIAIFLLGTVSKAQRKVKDKNNLNQIKSIEFMQWDFSPDWYYRSWYYKKVFGVRIKLPGLGLHDRGPAGVGGGDGYVRTDKRNIFQETPMVAATILNKSDAEKQAEETDKVFKQESAKFADRSIDYEYYNTKGNREELIAEINLTLTECSINGAATNHINTLFAEVERIKSNVTIIHESHMSNAKRREAYLGFEKELKEVLSLAKRLNNLNQIVNNERIN